MEVNQVDVTGTTDRYERGILRFASNLLKNLRLL